MKNMKNYQKLNDNRYLCDLNFDSASDEQKIALLNRIIDNELEKPENEVDMALVDECMAYIADLDGNRFHKTDAELTQGLQAIMFGSKQAGGRASSKAIGFKQFAKVASVFIAATLALVAIIAVAAKLAPNEDSPIPSTATPDSTAPQDVVITIDGIENAAYTSVEQLVQGENLSIHYLSQLPENIWLESVNLRRYENNQIDITFQFNSTSLQFYVCNDALFQGAPSNATQLANLDIDQYSFTLYLLSDGAYQAICKIGEYAYSITCTNYDDLINTLKHLNVIN